VPANDSDLNTLDIVAFATTVAITVIAVKAILKVGLIILSLSLSDIFIYRVSPFTL
jgi:hypothetical protein